MATDPWIGLIGTLSGVTAGGVISYFAARAQFFQQQQSAQKALIRNKLEEIYQLLDKITLSTVNRLPEDPTHGLKVEAELLLMETIMKLSMLVEFYAPALKPEIEALGAPLIEHAGMQQKIVEAASNRLLTQEEIQAFTEKVVSVNAHCSRVKEKLIALGREQLLK